MKALVATAYGDVDKLEMREVPEPPVGTGQVMVKVTAASINPVDWKLLAGQARTLGELNFPAILGRDVSGEVVNVGDGVNGLRVGDKVFGVALGAFAERVAAPEASWARIPVGLETPDAAALPLVVLTGAQLAEIVEPGRGDVILVTGAVGGVGRAAVFVAKSRGATVWAGVRGNQRAQARTLGADHVVALDYDSEVHKLPQFDAIADTVGGETIAELLKHLKKDGRLGSAVGESPAAKEMGVKTRAFGVTPNPKQLVELAEAVARGALTIPIAQRFPLAKGAEALKLARAGGIGKVLLLP